MSRHIQPLIEKIETHFQSLQQYQQQPIRAKLDPHLFSPDNETIADCLAQLQQTLSALKQATEPSQLEFYSEKLLAQYHALLEMLQPAATQPHFAPDLSKKTKKKHEIHNLPPKVRLEKYYQFLRQLNDLIAQQNEALQLAAPSQQTEWLHRIQQTEQRKQRCQDAIDNLEEYLIFVAERDGL